MKNPKWLEAEGYLVVIYPGKAPRTIKRDADIYKSVKGALKEPEKLYSILYPEEVVEKKTGGKVKVDSRGILTIKGKISDPALSGIAKDLAENNLPYKPLLKLNENILKNPNDWIRSQLFRFLEKNKVALTDDGCFMCYKGVKKKDGHLYDIHTGRICNDIGKTVEMSKDQVDLNPHNMCSRGLHVAAYRYVGNIYSCSTKIAVKIHPRDVCSVPYDYEDQKMRVCRYKVLAYMGEEKEMEHVYFPWDKEKLKAVKKETPKSKKTMVWADLDRMSGSAIIGLVLRSTSKIIGVSPKSKKSVISHALRTFEEEKTPVKGHQVYLDLDDVLEGAKKTVSLKGYSASQIKDKIKIDLDVRIPYSDKSKKSVVKEAVLRYAEAGYKTDIWD